MSEVLVRHTFGTKLWKREDNVKMSGWERPTCEEVD